MCFDTDMKTCYNSKTLQIIKTFLVLFSLPKCSSIPKYQNMSQVAECPNTPKSLYALAGKIYLSGQNVLIPSNCTPLPRIVYSGKAKYKAFGKQ